MFSTVKFNHELTRRSALKTMGILGAVAALRPSAISAATEKAATKITDADIFNFALNLESLETEYYLRGTMGKGMDDADAGENPGLVSGGNLVPWQNPDLHQFMEEVADNELAHVRYYRRVLGKKAVSRPEIDFGAFTAAAKAAGLGDNFDPFANEMNFFLGGMLMEDVGVTAYHGAAPPNQKQRIPRCSCWHSRGRGISHGHGPRGSVSNGTASARRGKCTVRHPR